jgi:hypothetical protein
MWFQWPLMRIPSHGLLLLLANASILGARFGNAFGWPAAAPVHFFLQTFPSLSLFFCSSHLALGLGRLLTFRLAVLGSSNMLTEARIGQVEKSLLVAVQGSKLSAWHDRGSSKGQSANP